MITWIVVITLAVLVVVILAVGGWALQTANRLDRLHVRYDLSWQALDGALARRAVVARAVAVDARLMTRTPRPFPIARRMERRRPGPGCSWRAAAASQQDGTSRRPIWSPIC